jgi:hypothetical protein
MHTLVFWCQAESEVAIKLLENGLDMDKIENEGCDI